MKDLVLFAVPVTDKSQPLADKSSVGFFSSVTAFCFVREIVPQNSKIVFERTRTFYQGHNNR